MSRAAARRIAWSLWVVCVLLALADLVLAVANRGAPGSSSAWDLILNLGFLAFPTVGALVASRYPRNAIGWIFVAVGVTLTMSFFASEYAIRALIADPGSLPYGEGMAWLSEWLFIPGLILAATFLLLLFPNGALPSRRWRPVAWLLVAATAVVTTALALTPGPLSEAPFTLVQNPFGVDGAKGLLERTAGVGFIVVFSIGVAASASLFVRFRRANGEERAQLKWITFAGVFLVPSLIATGALPPSVRTVAEALTLVFVTCLPIAAGIAILKYRLYEIDRIISRTLVYGALTTVLGASYAGLVLLGQAVFASFAGGSNLAIAVSTLLVAAMFLPGRSHVQAFVDRRFNRRRYDAQRTLEAFGARLRQQVDLETLQRELRGVVSETMQPAQVLLWLRGAGS